MKIALVAQHATPLRPRTGSGPDSDDIGLSELTRRLATHGHQVTVFAQRNQSDQPDQAELHDGVRVKHIDAGPVADGDRVKASGAAAARIRLEPAIGRSAAAVVATHSAEASDLASLGVHRSSIRVVPWGVDTDTFTPEGSVAKRNGRPRLLTAADLNERAPLQTLLRALSRVPGAELLVVGGPERADLPQDHAYVALARFAGALDISDRVIFTGNVDYAEMPALLRSADLVVSTCQYEPSGTTSLQAMACGTPVIAPPVGGHVDAVVDGTTGILIPPGRPALLAQRIRQLLAHPMMIEAYGVAAADRARSRYSWDRIAGETLAVYDRAIAQAA